MTTPRIAAPSCDIKPPPKIIVCKTDGAHILVDAEDYPLLSRFPWYRGGIGRHPMTFIYGKKDTSQTVYMHQLIMGGIVGPDHIDRDVLNNQKSNLRAATVQENSWNTGKRARCCGGKAPSSQFKGVTRAVATDGRVYWRVIIKLSKKGEKPERFVRLGPFASEIDAALAYNREIVKHRGERAYLNPIPHEQAA